jgi:hypothetical protein
MKFNLKSIDDIEGKKKSNQEKKIMVHNVSAAFEQ